MHDPLEKTVGWRMEIMLIEDSLPQARLTMGALRSSPVKHRLTLFRDGLEAVEFLNHKNKFAQSPRPDLILLDLRLPKLDGIEVLAEIRRNESLEQVPVVVMSASDDEQDRRQCEAYNVQSFITKPVNLEKFLALVVELRRFWRADVILPR